MATSVHVQLRSCGLVGGTLAILVNACMMFSFPSSVVASGNCYQIETTACCNWMTIVLPCSDCPGEPGDRCCWENAETEPATTNKLKPNQATGYDALSIYIKIFDDRCRYRAMTCDPVEGCVPGPVQLADCFAAGTTATGYNCGN